MKSTDSNRSELWLRHEGHQRVIAFLHGIGAKDSEDYWQGFLRVLLNDTTDDSDVFLWKYPTHVMPASLRNPIAFLKRKTLVETAPTIKRLGEAWGTTYTAQLSNYQEVVLICHSMGGLVVKSWIIDTLDSGGSAVLKQLKHIAFYATPHNGAPIARIIEWNNQILDMRGNGHFIGSLRNSWYKHVVAWKDNAPGPKDRLYNCYIPHIVVAGMSDRVVPGDCAEIQGMQLYTVEGDHYQVINPENTQDTRYKFWHDTVQEPLREKEWNR